MTGQYYQQPPPGQPYAQVPPEAQSIKSMLNITGILCLIAGVLLLIGGIIWIIIAGIFGAIFALPTVIAAIFWIIFYMSCKSISAMVDARQYEQAKSKTLLWMILGFIFGFLPGILLLIAYLKFDALINASRAQGYVAPPPPGQAPPPQTQQRLCLGCGQQIPLNFNNCPHCGKAVEGQHGQQQGQGAKRMCLGCGQQIDASFKACPHCGKAQ